MFQLEDCIAYITSRGAKTLAERLEDRFTGSGVSRVQWIAMYYVDRCPSITVKLSFFTAKSSPPYSAAALLIPASS